MPILDKQGKVSRIITILRDITGHVLADETKNEFLKMATHELKTPITSIKAFSQILGKMNKSSKNKEMKKYFRKMDNQITGLSELIDDLLNMAKLRQGKLSFYDKWFNLDSAVKESVKKMQKGCNQHKLIIKGATKKRFFGDKDRISKILINMINNAVKYSPNARRVIIILSTKTGIIKIGVKDFGIGISAKHNKRIFEQFYRVYGQKNKLFPGIGIGLFMSKEIAERYGAKMWVESREEKGSTFFLSLPISEKKRI
ncbi:MAG: two-component system sensor histidine kinase/met hyl-esterase/transferase hybrid [uncultured bacterium]|nr:MAG: two-component system sensor histidine kinase/met hyl-esterase/transferase hybrid [uncultured bacterium]